VPIILLLAIGFFVTALLYASVGFGGGSTYAALLALSGLDHRVLPLVVLACNIVVVAGSMLRFARDGLVPWKGALFLTALAAPAAFIGGTIPLERETFMTLLGASLVLTMITMLIPIPKNEESQPTSAARYMPIAAMPIGFLAGLVGIGGGIFLAPLLHLSRWQNARAIAATASFFILVNSLFALAGKLWTLGFSTFGSAISGALPLLIAVVVGGQIGSLLAAKFLPLRWIRWLTGALVGVVGIRLLLGV